MVSGAGPAMTPEQIAGLSGNNNLIPPGTNVPIRAGQPKISSVPNYVDWAKNPENVKKFQSTAKGEYGGPNAFSDVSNYQDLIAGINKASQAGEQVKSTGGRQELIKNVYSRPERAKAGMLGLDEALVSGTPSAMSSINEKAGNAAKLGDRVKQIEDSAGSAVAAQKDAVTKSREAVQNEFLGDTGAYQRLQNEITGQVGKTQKQVKAENDALKNYFDMGWLRKQGVIHNMTSPWSVKMGETAEPNKLTEQVDPKKINISDSQLKLLGITKPQYIDLLNKSLSATEKYKYGTYAQDLGTSGITGSNVATKQDYDRLAALEALLPQDINEKYISTPNQAGKYNSDITDFNYKGLLDFLKARQPIVPGTPLPAVDPSTTENPGIVNLPPMNVNSLTRRQRGVI